MNFTGFIFLVIAHFIVGRGVLQLFRPKLDLLPTICLSFIIGVPLLVLPPCVLQLMNTPITEGSLYTAISIAMAICCIPLFIYMKKPSFTAPRLPKIYELPAIGLIVYFMVLALWRCYYMPPYARDMLTGPELIAEYTAREHTMINSIFNIDLHTTNNYFKSPYVTCLQAIYKILVYPFGQLWLGLLSLNFVIWLFSTIQKRIHPLLAGLLMVLFITIPELFAYSFVVLYDYSNMVFFFTGFYFLTRYLRDDRSNDFALSVFLFGLATFIRTESLILVTFMAPLLMFQLYKKKASMGTIAVKSAIFVGGSVAFYILCIKVFVSHFVPVPVDVAHEITKNIFDIGPLFTRMGDILNKLIYSEAGTQYYGYFMFIFTAIFLTDLIFFRKYNREALFALYGIAVIYLGLSFIGYLLPLADLPNTTKRGLFKAIPMILLYMANSPVLLRISNAITNWENSTGDSPKPAPRPAPVKAEAPKPKQEKSGKK